MTVDAFFDRRPLHDVFDVVGAGLGALPFDDHAPRARTQRAGVLRRIALVEAEFVKGTTKAFIKASMAEYVGNGTATLMRADGTMEVVTVPR